MSCNEARTPMSVGAHRRALRPAAVGALLFALIASIALLFQPLIAMAGEQSAPVAITVEQVGSTDEYKIKVTNTGDTDMASVSGTTNLPQEIAADGQSEVVQWQIGALKAGESAYPQTDGKDATIMVKPSQQNPDNGDADDSKPSQGGTTTVDKKTDAKGNKLSETGSPVMAAVLLALSLVCFGVSVKWRNGQATMRRTIAAAGAIAMTATVAAAVPQASAAQRVERYSGIATVLTLNGTDYQLTSDVDVTYDDGAAPSEVTSIDYAKAMGAGWNLGNSFDGEDTDLTVPDLGEEAWGNPKVTRELIHSIKEKGYRTIRIPLTVDRRAAENADAKDDEYRYVIDTDWLARYREVIDWAVDEGLYVMVNVHHDSWIWLSNWDGDTSADEYRKYTDIWKQLAAYFADEPDTVSFETINEPQFNEGTDEEKQAKLDTVSKAAYDIIRATAGNEHRMIVVPTIGTAHDSADKLQALVDFIKNDLNADPYVLATVHYYSEWVYSANLGKTGFDEDLWGAGDYTPRDSIDQFCQRIGEYFTANGIGTVVGEYGLLGYDATSDGALQAGEELKYYEYMGNAARQNGFSYIFWDNGSGVDRATYQWKKPQVGTMLETSINQRSAYATGLDTVYLDAEPSSAVNVPLTLNGNGFAGIDGLTEGVDYTYDADTATVTLATSYLKGRYEAKEGTGMIADLTFRFDSGADWHEYLVKNEAPALARHDQAVTGTRADGLTIPMSYNGNELKSVTAYAVASDGTETRVGPNSSWWAYLQNGSSFAVHYDTDDRSDGTLTMLPAFFSDGSVTDGTIRLSVTFQSGETLDGITFDVAGDIVTLH